MVKGTQSISSLARFSAFLLFEESQDTGETIQIFGNLVLLCFPYTPGESRIDYPPNLTESTKCVSQILLGVIFHLTLALGINIYI